MSLKDLDVAISKLKKMEGKSINMVPLVFFATSLFPQILHFYLTSDIIEITRMRSVYYPKNSSIVFLAKECCNNVL